jgi:hypothetical protein
MQVSGCSLASVRGTFAVDRSAEMRQIGVSHHNEREQMAHNEIFAAVLITTAAVCLVIGLVRGILSSIWVFRGKLDHDAGPLFTGGPWLIGAIIFATFGSALLS